LGLIRPHWASLSLTGPYCALLGLIWALFGPEWALIGLGVPQCGDKCFRMDRLVPLSAILVNIMDTSGWMDSDGGRVAFFRIFGFLQKTLAARVSAPRRGAGAVQCSKLSSGGPLCSQASSSPWGGIMGAPEPRRGARSKIVKSSKFCPFGPRNPIFWLQGAGNGCGTPMSPVVR